MTEAPALERGLCICAAAAMLAMVLRWFIWFMAMATEAGGRLTGSRGCGIIMKGRSIPAESTDTSPMHPESPQPTAAPTLAL